MVPATSSAVALISTEPGATELTRPADETVARVSSLLVQEKVRPSSVLPAASWAEAVSCSVWPTCTAVAGPVTVTWATGAGSGGGSWISPPLLSLQDATSQVSVRIGGTARNIARRAGTEPPSAGRVLIGLEDRITSLVEHTRSGALAYLVPMKMPCRLVCMLS